jgi:OPA family glycerol-3-phosphate transporter-like MFS transporter
MGKTSDRLLGYQVLTVGLLVAGYAGYYLCRSNYSVTLPMMIDDLKAHGMDADSAKLWLGAIASVGTFAYAVGKFLSGRLADFLGGRRNFLLGMAGSVVFTALFALGGSVPMFTLAWACNRLVQSLGWVGMVKIASRWFSFTVYGSVMGILSLSFLWGDTVVRAFMGWLIAKGLGWREIFFTAAGVLGGLLAIAALLLRESPRQWGQPEPEASPENLYSSGGLEPTPATLRELLAPLARSTVFWLVCLLSLGLTLMRETFNTWTPTYFTESVGLSKPQAATLSGLFPLFGGFSVLLAGFLSDWLGRGGRAAIIFCGLVLTAALLLALGFANLEGSKWAPVALVTVVAFVMLGPYSYLAGAVALDFGGKRGSATACGIIDGVGYLGGILAGDSMARISVAYGWQGAWAVLAGVAASSCLVALAFWFDQRRPLHADVNTG